jgi:hypothetical protein
MDKDFLGRKKSPKAGSGDRINYCSYFLECVTTGKNFFREYEVFVGLVLGSHPSSQTFV